MFNIIMIIILTFSVNFYFYFWLYMYDGAVWKQNKTKMLWYLKFYLFCINSKTYTFDNLKKKHSLNLRLQEACNDSPIGHLSDLYPLCKLGLFWFKNRFKIFKDTLYPNLNGKWFGGPHPKFCLTAVFHPRWLLLLKIEISLNCKNRLILSWNQLIFEFWHVQHNHDNYSISLICIMGINQLDGQLYLFIPYNAQDFAQIR
jgi:hypothetical protein